MSIGYDLVYVVWVVCGLCAVFLAADWTVEWIKRRYQSDEEG